jgi:hypothetical protein
MVKDLVGKWISDPADTESIRDYGQVSLDFSSAGRLVYAIHGAGKRQFILLEYRVEGNVLVTDQTSNPQPEKTAFEISPEGKLLLFYKDRRSVYIRDSN